jgi:short-subunit dehydrogenase
MINSYYTLITGAGKGFGKELAFECASRKMNLVLVALPGENLSGLVSFIIDAYGIDAIGIEKDLCKENACRELYEQVTALRLEVNMLINNAGVGCTEFFEDGCIHHYEKQIGLNVLATTLLTRLFIDTLKRNAPAYILNVGSLASFFLLAKKQVYGATKSYICYFSKSLRRELKEAEVHVTVVCPGGMYTNQSAIETINTGDYISRASGMHPEDVAPIAIDGLLKKKEVVIPGKINSTIAFLNGVLPRVIVSFFEVRTMKRLHTPKKQPVPVYSLPTYSNEVNKKIN